MPIGIVVISGLQISCDNMLQRNNKKLRVINKLLKAMYESHRGLISNLQRGTFLPNWISRHS